MKATIRALACVAAVASMLACGAMAENQFDKLIPRNCTVLGLPKTCNYRKGTCTLGGKGHGAGYGFVPLSSWL